MKNTRLHFIGIATLAILIISSATAQTGDRRHSQWLNQNSGRTIEPPTQGKKLEPAAPPTTPSTTPVQTAPMVPTDNAAANQLAQDALRLMRYNRLEEAEARLRLALFKDPSNALAQDAMRQLQEKKELMVGREIREKLTNLIVDEVNFSAVPLGAVIDYIADESQKLSADGKGVNVILKAPPEFEQRPVTFKLRKVPLIDVLKYACQFTGMKMQFEQYAVVLVPAPPPPTSP